jgi:hypothetical protein
MICVTYDVSVFTYDRKCLFRYTRTHLLGPGAAPGKTQQCTASSAAGSSADLHYVSRLLSRGPQNLATGSDFRCHSRGIKRVIGKTTGLCAPPAVVHPTGHLKPVGLRQAKALFGSLDLPEWDGARSNILLWTSILGR